MGKRELLIISAFVVLGTITYWFTAPPSKPGERTFSISQMFRGIKREISANASSARIAKNGSLKLPATVSELRVSTPRSVPLTVIGEAREDIAFEMPVDSTGPDEATAKEWASRVELRKDDLGTAMALSLYFPEEGTQNATLTLKVPARLAVRVESSGRIHVSHVTAVELRNPAGEVAISDISGAVTGTHRSGELTVTGAATVNMTVVSSRVKFRGVTDGVTLNARSGECSIAESSGPIVASLVNAELTVDAFKNSIKVTGDGGRTRVLAAQDVSIDARRMILEVDAVAGPGNQLTLITTDEPLRLTLEGGASAALDALATAGGEIRAADFALTPVKEAKESRISATLGKGGARFVLRNTRGDIVIARRK